MRKCCKFVVISFRRDCDKSAKFIIYPNLFHSDAGIGNMPPRKINKPYSGKTKKQRQVSVGQSFISYSVPNQLQQWNENLN